LQVLQVYKKGANYRLKPQAHLLIKQRNNSTSLFDKTRDKQIRSPVEQVKNRSFCPF